MRVFHTGWEICSTPSIKLQARVRDAEPAGPTIAFADLVSLP